MAHLAHRAERAGPFLAERAAVGDDGLHHVPLASDDLVEKGLAVGNRGHGHGFSFAARAAIRRSGSGVSPRAARIRLAAKSWGSSDAERAHELVVAGADVVGERVRVDAAGAEPLLAIEGLAVEDERRDQTFHRRCVRHLRCPEGPVRPRREGGAQIEVPQGLSSVSSPVTGGVTNGDISLSGELRGDASPLAMRCLLTFFEQPRTCSSRSVTAPACHGARQQDRPGTVSTKRT